jgi:thiol-disulfide isomerase/thioredoxin
MPSAARIEPSLIDYKSMKTQHANYLGCSVLIAAGTAFLTLAPVPCQAQPANDLFANRQVLSGASVVQSGSSVGATKEPGEPNHAGDSGGKSVWFSWTAPQSGLVGVATTGSSFDTVLEVYTGTSLTSLTPVAWNDDEGGGLLTSRVNFEVIQNRTYQIAVDGYGGASGTYVLRITPAAAAPAWRLPDVNGQMIASTAFAGKVVVLDFWGVWCPYCVAEIPDLVALQTKYRADGLAIVGMDYGDSLATVQAFIPSHDVNYTVVMATGTTLQDFGGIDGFPTTFVLDRQNRIANKFIGQQDFSTFEQAVIPLLYCNARLAAHASGSQMVFAWPTNAATFLLESASTTHNPVWTQWPVAPTVINGSNTVSVTPTDGARFFRLHLTN